MIQKMKFLFTIILTVFTLTVISQQADTPEIPSNSFKNSYLKSNPTLNYGYDDISQIHNYSNNWDLDKDGIKDELYFVGTGGGRFSNRYKVIFPHLQIH